MVPTAFSAFSRRAKVFSESPYNPPFMSCGPELNHMPTLRLITDKEELEYHETN